MVKVQIRRELFITIFVKGIFFKYWKLVEQEKNY